MRNVLCLFVLVMFSGCKNSSNKSSCPMPFTTCGTTCTATSVDPANCGSCGNACAAGQRCVSGACTLSCPAGAMQCGSSCTDVMTSNSDCGTCGNKCAAGKLCSGGACADTCSGAFTSCGSYCADTANDSQNCGTCGTVCPTGQRCASGACSDSCAAGTSPCGGRCVDLQSDAANCGACGMACPTGEACQAGACACGWATLGLGRMQSCALRADGTVVCAGGLNNSCDNGQFPNGIAPCSGAGAGFGTLPPAQVPGLSSVKQIDAGDSYLCALKTDGTVWCLGSNLFGMLGDGVSPNPSPSTMPTQVRDSNAPTFLSDVKQISAGKEHACGLKNNGEIWCWGNNNYAQLGTGAVGPFSALAVKATLPIGLTNPSKVVAGFHHTCALASDKTVWCWGRNDFGECGTGDLTDPEPTPQPIAGLSNVSDVQTKWHHSCAILSDKTLVCWGKNAYDQVGVDRALQLNVTLPSPVPGLTNVAEVGTGSFHTCARTTDGAVWCWGRNVMGDLGDGTQDQVEISGGEDSGPKANPSPTPRPVLTAAGTQLIAKSLAVNHNHSCAVVGVSNHPFCWGNNLKGQAGLTSSYSIVAQPIYSCGN